MQGPVLVRRCRVKELVRSLPSAAHVGDGLRLSRRHECAGECEPKAPSCPGCKRGQTADMNMLVASGTINGTNAPKPGGRQLPHCARNARPATSSVASPFLSLRLVQGSLRLWLALSHPVPPFFPSRCTMLLPSYYIKTRQLEC